MKILKLAVLPLALALATSVSAKTLVSNETFPIDAGKTLTLKYNFDSATQHINCFDVDHPSYQANVHTEWTYNGAQQAHDGMPLSLSDSSSITGYWADPAGLMYVTNNTDAVMYVQCNILS